MTSRDLLTWAVNQRTWAVALAVVVCLLTGMHIGDVRAADADREQRSLYSLLVERRIAAQTARAEAITAESSMQAARRRTARAALDAHLAGVADAAALLPPGMRFACRAPDSAQCVVVADGKDRTVTLVWPAYRPSWGLAVGLPPGGCDGTLRTPVENGLSRCERRWLLMLPPPRDQAG